MILTLVTLLFHPLGVILPSHAVGADRPTPPRPPDDTQVQDIPRGVAEWKHFSEACERGSAALPCPIIEAFQFISAKSSDRVRSAATLIAPSTARAAPKAVLRKPQD